MAFRVNPIHLQVVVAEVPRCFDPLRGHLILRRIHLVDMEEVVHLLHPQGLGPLTFQLHLHQQTSFRGLQQQLLVENSNRTSAFYVGKRVIWQKIVRRRPTQQVTRGRLEASQLLGWLVIRSHVVAQIPQFPKTCLVWTTSMWALSSQV